jgi:hypothetical protein
MGIRQEFVLFLQVMKNFSLLRWLSFILWIFLTGGVGSAFADVDEAFLQSVLDGDRKEAESLLELGADIEA